MAYRYKKYYNTDMADKIIVINKLPQYLISP